MRKIERHRKRIQRYFIIGVVAVAAALCFFEGCEGLPNNVANCPVTPTAPSDLTIIPPAQEPPPPALCGFPLSIASPSNGANVMSPVPIVAAATPPDPIYTVRLYVDGKAVLYTPNTRINQLIWMADGQHRVEIVAEDTAGYIATTSMQVNVTGQEPGAMNIQDSFDWVLWSAVIVNSLDVWLDKVNLLVQ